MGGGTKAHFRRELVHCVKKIEEFLNALDVIMNSPSTVDRGKKVAALCNQLEMLKDQVKHFTLGLSLKKKSKRLTKVVDERERAAAIVRRHLMFNDQRATLWHEAHDCMTEILKMNPEEPTP